MTQSTSTASGGAPSSTLGSIPAATSSLSGFAFPSDTSDLEELDYDDGNDSGITHNGVLNYYFLLLAVLVVAIVVAYFVISRRRYRRLSKLQNNRQDALARDLEGWQDRGGWCAAHHTKPEEGLDERGLPPPPYIPAPEPIHPGSSNGGREPAIPLQNLHAHASDQKLPEYSERTVNSTSAGTHSSPHL